jgi:hypothetical protein
MLTSWIQTLVDWLRRQFGGDFVTEEVRALLRRDASTDPRAALVYAAASDTRAWTTLLKRSDRFELGQIAGRLPAVVFWYTSGVSTEEIGRRLGFFGGAWDGEQAINTASRLIAISLNRGAADAGRRFSGSGRPRPQNGPG